MRFVAPQFSSLALLGVSVLLASCAGVGGPAGSGNVIARARKIGLVHAPEAIPGVKIDLRYRSGGNAGGRPLYPANMPCLVNRSTAVRLAKAQKLMQSQGYGLKIWDAWRPVEAHQALWNAVKDPRYVVPPSDGLSLHCYGIAVDVTLVDSLGRELRMPSKYDEFSPAAKARYTGGDPEIRRNVEALQSAMRDAGFRSIPDEWWHFDNLNATNVRRVSAESVGLKLPY